MTYAEAIKKLISKMLLTQMKLANYLGVSFASIIKWETGKHEPTTKIKRRIVELRKENNIKLEEQQNG